jgi:hypothetical protein
MVDDLLQRIVARTARKRTISCRRCPWSKYGDALKVVLAYDEHIIEEHCGLADIGHLEVDHERARDAASYETVIL